MYYVKVQSSADNINLLRTATTKWELIKPKISFTFGCYWLFYLLICFVSIRDKCSGRLLQTFVPCKASIEKYLYWSLFMSRIASKHLISYGKWLPPQLFFQYSKNNLRQLYCPNRLLNSTVIGLVMMFKKGKTLIFYTYIFLFVVNSSICWYYQIYCKLLKQLMFTR